MCISCTLGKKEYSNHAMPINLQRSKFHCGTGTLPNCFGKIAHPVLSKENKNLHNSTEKNKENMKGWDYSQHRNGDYHLREST